ncbi:hypothetical protein [Lysinibacillus xylanilyticus]|uniref:Uncharacterized protein n=1 Tax=Lysinibacillus xylanilyticus TaxID=582475 RepID=A0A2M9QA05_9BACI|nr:hypothetical protein [Lysinibacillus xylanilyticus]PJO44911.1 hypothetical protein CWD94_04285 [Lysinibacillus xylanilyticus]
MAPPTNKRLSSKQLEILRFILKVRMAKVHQILSYLRPELKGKSRQDKDFESGRKVLSKTLKLLQDAGYIKQHRVSDSTEVYYYLTQEGQSEVYSFMGITELDKNRHSGFDFDLGFFPWRVPPVENVHSRFQTEIQCNILSLNRQVEEAARDVRNGQWVFGGVKLKNVCSLRDNLHASPRNSKIKDSMQYKPDGEICLNLSRYDDQGELIDTHGELTYYFMEYDRKTEYGERLLAKFKRLNSRLKELRANNKLQYYKGMIVVLEDPRYDNNQKVNDLQVNLRYLSFLKAFKTMCGEFTDEFNIIATTVSNLESTILSLRTEYSKDFKYPLVDSFRFKELHQTFHYSDPNNDGRLYDYFKQTGDIIGRFTSDRKYYCVFFNIEGLNTMKWKRCIEVFNNLHKVAVDKNETYIVTPIVVFRKLFPYGTGLIDPSLQTGEEKLFYERLFLLDLRINRPILYKELEPIDFSDSMFIV